MTFHGKRFTIDPAKAKRSVLRVKEREARADMRSKQKQYVANPLSDIMRPDWSSRDDLRILQLKAEGRHFHAIAKKLKRTAREIEQRFHRLRAIKGIEKKLEDYGINMKPYPECPE